MIASPATRLFNGIRPISTELLRAARATMYDSEAIRRALDVIRASREQLRYLMDDPSSPAHSAHEWEGTPELAECSSLIESAGTLLAVASSPTTPERLRGICVRRAYWVLRVAAERTDALLRKEGR